MLGLGWDGGDGGSGLSYGGNCVVFAGVSSIVCLSFLVFVGDVDDGLHESFLEGDECFEAGVVVESDASFDLVGELSADVEEFNDGLYGVYGFDFLG